VENVGSYSVPGTGSVGGGVAAFFPGPYRLPMLSFTNQAVYTNTCGRCAYRGPWLFETVAREQMMDVVARAIGIDPLALRREYFARNLQMVGAQHRAGVPFLAGTDAAPGVYIVPGFSLHDELANFVEAGFSPMESLQTATSNPAKFLGTESRTGSIESGKIADLVLLRANPLDDIRNTQQIDAVIANGRLFDRPAIDRILAQVEASAKHPK